MLFYPSMPNLAKKIVIKTESTITLGNKEMGHEARKYKNLYNAWFWIRKFGFAESVNRRRQMIDIHIDT